MFLKKEVWKNIIGYENIYQVSNRGRIKSLKFGQENIMKLKKWKNGYMRIDLCKSGKKKYCLVHRYTEIDINKEFIIQCPISSTGICKVKDLGEDTEETYNMKICGAIEITDSTTKQKVGVKQKLSPSQRMRLAIEGRAERRGIVDSANIEAYYEATMNNLINKLNN